MTSAKGAGARSSGKSLKEQTRWQLWIIVASNALFLYSVIEANAIRLEGVRSAFRDAHNLLSVGLALVITTVLNGFLSAETKARLVFLRWHYALPGHRAFSEHAVRDPRIDISVLEQLNGSALPADPAEQNRLWYRIYKQMETDPAVLQVHRDFLLLRDFTGLCALFIVFYGAVSLYAIRSQKVALVYLLTLVAQYFLVRQAAANYGVRFVTTVLARRIGNEWPDTPKPSRKRARRKNVSSVSEHPKK